MQKETEHWFGWLLPLRSSWNGDQATLTFVAGRVLENDYTTARTRVSSVVEAANINTCTFFFVRAASSSTKEVNRF